MRTQQSKPRKQFALILLFILITTPSLFAGTEPGEQMVSAGNHDSDHTSLTLTELWQHPIAKGQIYGATTAIGGGGKVFIGSSEKMMYAFDSESGQLAWEFKAMNAIYTKGCIIESDQINGIFSSFLIFTDHSGTLYCLDGNTGQLQWEERNQRCVLNFLSYLLSG